MLTTFLTATALIVSPAVALAPPAQLAQAPRRSVLGGAAAALVVATPSIAGARGRGTQPAMYLRYSPRIVSFGEYLKSDLPKKIEASDWAALKEDTAADLKKKGKVGPLYAGASAMTLWAATYSETAITPTTKELDAQVEVLVNLRETLLDVALKGTGEGLKKTGGFFGIGGKQEPAPSPAALKKEAMTALAAAKTAYNEYIAVNNKVTPFEINPLPSI